jgi:tRNA nucleotidyltransferase (CCA-adding enzyme)
MHPQAMEDLHAGILRPCGKDSLTSDPLRVFRAARFLASWPDFQPSRDLLAAMAETARHGLLERIPAERMGRETLAAMNASNPGRYLQVLDRTGCLAPWFRELENASSIPAGPGPYHDSDTLTHIGRVMDALAGRQEPLLPWMGLCHDLGKTATDPDILPSHHGHEVRGADMATQLGRRLRMPERWVLAGATAARHHMVLARYRELRPGTRVDLLMELHAKRLVREMVALVQADRSSSPHRSPAPGLAEAVESDLAAVLAVRLPAEHRDQGEASGQRLRQMRCKALDRS